MLKRQNVLHSSSLANGTDTCTEYSEIESKMTKHKTYANYGRSREQATIYRSASICSAQVANSRCMNHVLMGVAHTHTDTQTQNECVSVQTICH